MADQTNSWKREEIERGILFRDVELKSVLGLLQDCPVHELNDDETGEDATWPCQGVNLTVANRRNGENGHVERVEQ